MESKISHLFLKTAHKAPMEQRDSITAVAGKGLAGDVAFGKNRRQVLLIEAEALDEFHIPPGILRENGVTVGIALAGSPPGTRLRIGSVVLEVTMDCDPCNFMETVREGLEKAMDGRRGTLFKVVEGGELQVGNPISLEG